MSYNISTLSALQQLINTFIEEQGCCPMLSHELETVIHHLRNRNKGAALKMIRESTKTCEKVLFNLDLRRISDVCGGFDPNKSTEPYSDFTAWVARNDVTLTTGEVKTRYLGLKKAKDLADFIELNLRYLAG